MCHSECVCVCRGCYCAVSACRVPVMLWALWRVVVCRVSWRPVAAVCAVRGRATLRLELWPSVAPGALPVVSEEKSEMCTPPRPARKQTGPHAARCGAAAAQHKRHKQGCSALAAPPARALPASQWRLCLWLVAAALCVLWA